jgi:peptidoglycan/LPS O-acetylase OafA/YrhL
MCLVITSFAFAPVAGLAGGGWNLPGAFGYITGNVTLRIREWGIGDTLADMPFPRTWNGSLWTLFYEFGCYVLIGLFYVIKTFRRPIWTLNLFMVTTVLLAAHRSSLSGPVSFTDYPAYLLAFFLAGAVISQFRNSIVINKSLFALAVLVIAASMSAGWDVLIAPFPLAYCVMWLSCKFPRIVERLGDGSADISYGMYIYAFPIQQLLVVAGVNEYGLIPLIITSITLTFLPAILSWFLVEKPCLRFKKLAPPFPHITRKKS